MGCPTPHGGIGEWGIRGNMGKSGKWATRLSIGGSGNVEFGEIWEIGEMDWPILYYRATTMVSTPLSTTTHVGAAAPLPNF